MTTPNTNIPTPIERIESQCSGYGDGARWCDFCHQRITDTNKKAVGHKDDCPLSLLKHELIAAEKCVEAWAAFANHQVLCAVCGEDVSDCEKGSHLRNLAISEQAAYDKCKEGK